MEEKVMLVISGEIGKILPLKSVGRKKAKVVGIHCADYGDFWATKSKRYEGEEDPVAILIDGPSFEPKVLANQFSEMIDDLQKWHPGIPILQLKYQMK